ncbi:hypothetical protein [Actinoplanes sp. NPDC051411]|uniref:hypothetical protein n=1 Tax=Actinoplanes sp. NPDC051411 TaxID=3155522 RepID=UPI003419219D
MLRIAVDKTEALWAEALELVGDLGRPGIYRDRSRRGLLRVTPVDFSFDAWGYLENWALEAVRMMIRRDAELLTDLLADDDPRVRGCAAYAVAVALHGIGPLRRWRGRRRYGRARRHRWGFGSAR